MKLVVEDRGEAIEIAGTLVEICNAIRQSNIDDILQTSYEIYLCRLRESIGVADESNT